MLFKCVMFQIVQKYRLRFADGYQYPPRIQHFPFAKPADNLPLVLTSLASVAGRTSSCWLH
jgi:hypothetical protein